MVRLTLLVLAFATLAGCSQPEMPAAGADAILHEGEGTLRGVVVDDAVRPVAQAAIRLTGSGAERNTTTGDDGQFLFVGLAPGTYLVEASKTYYGAHQQAVVVEAGIETPEIVKFQLVFEPGSLPFATVYKYDGMHECGLNVVRVCSNVNIATWIVLCANTGLCMGNVTSDRSLFFQYIDGAPTFLQAELVWTATLPGGEALTLLVGGGTQEELRAGVSLPAYNLTSGPSPLVARVSNHEGPSAWCRNVPDPPCGERALEESGIGVTRALLGQVDAGPALKADALCGSVDPCGVGHATQQKFSLYTSVFYGYEPPADWLFSDEGLLPPPPI